METARLGQSLYVVWMRKASLVLIMETDRYRRSFRSVGRECLCTLRWQRALNSKGLKSSSVLRAPLHGLPEAPVTVRVTVCPSAVGLVRQAVLSFMNECSDWVGSVRLSVDVWTMVLESDPAKKLIRSPSQKNANATRTMETKQNLTNDFISTTSLALRIYSVADSSRNCP